MTIEVKRNCSSSVRTTLDKVSFGDFTITISKAEYEFYRLAKQKYRMESDTALLTIAIRTGLAELAEADE